MTCRLLAMAAFVALVEHAALPGAIAAPGGPGTSKSTSADSMITVVKAGSGTGSVVAGAGVIDCGATCSGL